MGSFKFIFVVVVLLLGASPVQAECERNGFGVFESEACAAAAYAEADKQLNATYQKLLAGLGEEEKQKLLVAQRAWLAYKKANAEFVYAMEGGGSLGRMIVANSAEQQTIARTKELSGWLRGE